MKIVRFKAGGKTRYGVLEGARVVEYSGTPFGAFRRGRKKFPLKQVVLLAPVVPSKIVAVGLNYRDHAQELNAPIPEEPILFLKPPTALIGPNDPIVYPALSERVDYEAELGIVIKKRCRHDRGRTASGPAPSPSTRSARWGRASPRISIRTGWTSKPI